MHEVGEVSVQERLDVRQSSYYRFVGLQQVSRSKVEEAVSSLVPCRGLSFVCESVPCIKRRPGGATVVLLEVKRAQVVVQPPACAPV